MRRGISPWRATLKLAPDNGVALVEIRAKFQCAIGTRKRGLVGQEYRYWRWQAVPARAAYRDLLIDHVDRLLIQQRSQFEGILHPDAAMADPAVAADENRLVRRVVQVHVEAVRHVEHDQPKPCLGPRQLLHFAIGPQDHVVSCQVIRVATDSRQDFRDDNVSRDDPWRIEEARLDRGAKLGALIALRIIANNDPQLITIGSIATGGIYATGAITSYYGVSAYNQQLRIRYNLAQQPALMLPMLSWSF